MKIVLLGPPGTGKGSQAERIKGKYSLAHISTGDMLRAELRSGSELGKQAQAYIDKGELVPDAVIIGMVEARLNQPDCEKGFMLDGFPRTVAQANALEAITKLDVVLNIDTPIEKLIDRISGRRMCPACGAVYHISTYSLDTCSKCGKKLYQRDDDKEETVKNRLNVYLKQTQPLIDYYAAKKLLVNIDGNRPIDDVFEDVKVILEKFDDN